MDIVNSDPMTRHQVVFEPPDLILSAPQTTLTVEDAMTIWNFINEATTSVERFYWIANISSIERAPPGVRSPEMLRGLSKLHGLACIKGSFTQRTIMMIASRAARLLGLRLIESEVAFFDDEAEARVWIESLRRQFNARAK